MSLRDLYQEMIVEHSKSPRNFHSLKSATLKGEGYNPLCGDRFTIYVKLKGDLVEEVCFEGSGCAISTASASLMTEGVQNKSKAEVARLADTFHQLVTGKAAEVSSGLGKLVVFEGVQEFPVRVKCATLAWHTLKSLLEGKDRTVSTE